MSCIAITGDKSCQSKILFEGVAILRLTGSLPCIGAYSLVALAGIDIFDVVKPCSSLGPARSTVAHPGKRRQTYVRSLLYAKPRVMSRRTARAREMRDIALLAAFLPDAIDRRMIDTNVGRRRMSAIATSDRHFDLHLDVVLPCSTHALRISVPKILWWI